MATDLNLDSMHDRHPALTEAITSAYQEAASVCLGRHHRSPVAIMLSDNGTESGADIRWISPDARTVGAWANTTDAAEAGAYCCVIAGVEYIRRLVAVRRAETGTGADYYVGPDGAGRSDLEDCLRLEVSGVDAGDNAVVDARLRSKVKQAKRGESSLPALAGVIGFAAKVLMICDVAEER